MIASKLLFRNVVKGFAYGNPKPCFRDIIVLKADNILNIIAFYMNESVNMVLQMAHYQGQLPHYDIS